MMEITRNVILDLLPLYLADEVSADTRAIVEEYLETDPELAELAKQSAAIEFPGDIPVSLTAEDEMKTYKKTKWMVFLFALLIAAMMALALLGVLATFFLSSG
jgi:anti-sigma factor RsiW